MSMKNSIDTIGYRTRSASTNCATVGVQAGTLAYFRRPRYVDITHESHSEKEILTNAKLYVIGHSVNCWYYIHRREATWRSTTNMSLLASSGFWTTLCSTGNRSMNVYGALVERFWQGKRKFWDRNAFQCHCVRYKSHVDWPWIEHVSAQWQAGG